MITIFIFDVVTVEPSQTHVYDAMNLIGLLEELRRHYLGFP